MPYGTELLPNGEVRFRLWAPAETEVTLVNEVTGERESMTRLRGGWHECTTGRFAAGARYRYERGNGLRVPDPASRFQPEDVHGPSEVIDPNAYEWHDSDWRGRPWHEAVLYELHLGTFTPEGTFAAAAGKLDYLAELGVTAIEIMPVADFPGRWNWGYDGVLPFAPDSSYGRPEDFKALVDAAHQRGIMVLLDVVYNHFGPDGNHLACYAPAFFTDRHRTPWGDAINFDGERSLPVREFFIHNALYWVEEFHVDGLRLDAVHQIADESQIHILTELAERVRGTVQDRHVHLVLENEHNQARHLTRDERGNPRWYTSQWNDDVHHTLHVAATEENAGYYADYAGDTVKLARSLAEGFAFQGEAMTYRGSARGEPSADLPPNAFVAFIQNHDQIGNRAFGERLGALAPEEALRAVSATYLLLPQVPMIFMGEEWKAAQPFLFFSDFAGELGDAVRKGRREEFARFREFQDLAIRSTIPDPQAKQTFHAAKLVWEDISKPQHAEWLEFYRELLAVRRRKLLPLISRIERGGRYDVLGPGAVIVRWRLPDNNALTLAANLSHRAATGFRGLHGRVIWKEGSIAEDGRAEPWSVLWSVA